MTANQVKLEAERAEQNGSWAMKIMLMTMLEHEGGLSQNED